MDLVVGVSVGAPVGPPVGGWFGVWVPKGEGEGELVGVSGLGGFTGDCRVGGN